ncbi:hypothetical protein [Phreatobacter stygius]|uniref:DUF1579 domain-containing protein n=1 Tax=Phreatobacter stygius TaxID=1940610 RepID=A0A4D7ASP9_9HYPH|nr:hypothetical protein [Phreatobacter stygius]QCI63979.1 hypothetical protein E8M01_06795 [Phreatobacter stygius]
MTARRGDVRALQRDFSAALLSAGRSSDMLASDDIYAPLLGIWDVDTWDFTTAGATIEGRGEWLFCRVLEGRAVQDVWIAPPRGAGGARQSHPHSRYGTSLRTLDPATRHWQVVWLNPVSGTLDVLQAHGEAGRIVQTGTGSDGQPIRWSFDQLTAVSFRWIGEAEQADGSWRAEAVFRGRRRS